MRDKRPITIFITAVLTVSTAGLMGTVRAADNPNPFNRLFVPPKERVTSIKDDGVHDPDVPGLKLLQEPKDAFAPLAPSGGGNNVNWVEAVKKNQIKPHYDHLDASKEPLPLELFIVMEVKGSMPNVSFPHKQHTEILECTNCHDSIFKPLKGGNPMSMAEIMLGQKCGLCHGSVAFPVTECRRCHTESK